MSWPEQTCKTCVYRINLECRRFPPTQHRSPGSVNTYPVVQFGYDTREFPAKYADACVEHLEKETS